MPTTSTPEEIESVCEEVACFLYKSKQGETISELRKRSFLQKVAKAKSFVKPERLPPTSSSLRYHSFRVYHQISMWLGILDIKAEKWGWFRSNDMLLPRTMDKKPAPDSLLKTIGCNCQEDCSSFRCGCRKGSYQCSSLCGKCQVNGCTNVQVFLLEELELEVDDFEIAADIDS